MGDQDTMPLALAESAATDDVMQHLEFVGRLLAAITGLDWLEGRDHARARATSAPA